ncbi:hypothetical protein D9M69_499810 [compost metagenome]
MLVLTLDLSWSMVTVNFLPGSALARLRVTSEMALETLLVALFRVRPSTVNSASWAWVR